MPNGDNITKNQHYIPQTFLKGFSNDGKMICRYDLVKKTQQIDIPIKSIAYEKYLYEIKNKDGTICDPNHIEKKLAQIESQFARYKKRIEDSVKCEHNYNSKCFLNPDEKNFWIFYILFQMLRHKDSIKLVIDDLLENAEFSNETDAKNAMVCTCLPFNQNIQSFQNYVRQSLPVFDQVAFVVGYDETGSLFINDRIGCFISKGKVYRGLKKWKLVLFPISSNIIIQMYNLDIPENQQLKDRRNVLLRLDKINLLFVKKSIANYADKMILSPCPLSDNEIKMIEELQKNKFKD